MLFVFKNKNCEWRKKRKEEGWEDDKKTLINSNSLKYYAVGGSGLKVYVLINVEAKAMPFIFNRWAGLKLK